MHLNKLRPFWKLLCVVLAGAFLIYWGWLHLMWGIGSLMGNAMMNDSGKMSGFTHHLIIYGVMFGQLVTGIAGIPASLAFFWWSKTRYLLKIAGFIFLGGAVLQIGLFVLGFSIIGTD